MPTISEGSTESDPPLPSQIIGTWTSNVRDTLHGAMWFEFRVGEDGSFEVTGTPTAPTTEKVFQRSGPYLLQGNQLVSPAINEGRPVQVGLETGDLVVKIDEELEFRLRRK